MLGAMLQACFVWKRESNPFADCIIQNSTRLTQNFIGSASVSSIFNNLMSPPSQKVNGDILFILAQRNHFHLSCVTIPSKVVSWRNFCKSMLPLKIVFQDVRFFMRIRFLSFSFSKDAQKTPIHDCISIHSLFANFPLEAFRTNIF